MAIIDLKDQRFGKWLVVAYQKDGCWMCRCDCGREFSISGTTLRNGTTKSCRPCWKESVKVSQEEARAKRKASIKRYRQSEKGRAKKKEIQGKYYLRKGRETVARYQASSAVFAEYFSSDASKASRARARDKFRSTEKGKESTRSYRDKMRDKILAWGAEYRKSERGRAARSAYGKTYAKSAKRLAYEKLWRNTPHGLEKLRLARQRRRARMQKAKNTLTQQEWSLVARLWGACAYCGDWEKKLTVDHLMPLAHGGDHALENIVPACKTCNSSKNARPVEKLERLSRPLYEILEQHHETVVSVRNTFQEAV